MLNLTNNMVDYMYYSLDAALPVNASSLSIRSCGGEYIYVFASSSAAPAGAAPVPLRRLSSSSHSASASYEHSFALPAAAAAAAAAGGSTRLNILVAAMGLQAVPIAPAACKGLQSIRAGKVDLSTAGWQSKWVFPGEAAQYYSPAGSAQAPWAPVEASGGSAPTSWFKASMALPSAPPQESHSSQGPFPQLAYALDMQGATKGLLWVNGFLLGRYNLERGQCSGACAPPQHGPVCSIFWHNCSEPTQRFYGVPSSLLQPADNLVVLFEEASTVPVPGSGPAAPSPPPQLPGSVGRRAAPAAEEARNLATVALVVLTEHPF
jgi:hypothetical protein